jgi:hypothetical protein
MRRLNIIFMLGLFLFAAAVIPSCKKEEITQVEYLVPLWKGSLASAPQNPEAGWAYYDTVKKQSFIFDGTSWQVMSQDGLNGKDGQNGQDGQDGKDGTNGQDGLSIVWKGEFSAAPEKPETNWAYYNTADKKSFIYNGEKWQTLAQDGADGQDGKDGKDAPILVMSITLNKTSTEITGVGGEETLSVTDVLPSNATDKTYTWSSSDSNIATVDPNGKVTAVAAGTATIYATANDGSNAQGACEVTVKAEEPLLDWSYSDICNYTLGKSMGGITIEGGMKEVGNLYNGTWTFTIDGGRKIKKIEMASTYTTFSGNGVTLEDYSFYSTQDWENVDGKKITWTGNASSVAFSGLAYAVEYIKIEIE